VDINRSSDLPFMSVKTPHNNRRCLRNAVLFGAALGFSAP